MTGFELPIVLATGNTDKARELSELMSEAFHTVLVTIAVTVGDKPVGFVVERPENFAATLERLVSLDEAPDVEEIGSTLEENARIKARGVGAALGLPVVADDTGLEIDALGGAPGVRRGPLRERERHLRRQRREGARLARGGRRPAPDGPVRNGGRRP